MPYARRAALGGSLFLLLGGVALIALYVTCNSLNCLAVSVTYWAPVWTGCVIVVAALTGILMSCMHQEKAWGELFFLLSVLGVLATVACTFFTVLAAFAEYGFQLLGIRIDSLLGIPLPTRVPISTSTTPTVGADSTLALIIWCAMAGVSFISFITSCVTSCQACCCCQERVIVQRPWPVQVPQSRTGHDRPRSTKIIVNASGVQGGNQHIQQTSETNRYLSNPQGNPANSPAFQPDPQRSSFGPLPLPTEPPSYELPRRPSEPQRRPSEPSPVYAYRNPVTDGSYLPPRPLHDYLEMNDMGHDNLADYGHRFYDSPQV